MNPHNSPLNKLLKHRFLQEIAQSTRRPRAVMRSFAFRGTPSAVPLFSVRATFQSHTLYQLNFSSPNESTHSVSLRDFTLQPGFKVAEMLSPLLFSSLLLPVIRVLERKGNKCYQIPRTDRDVMNK